MAAVRPSILAAGMLLLGGCGGSKSSPVAPTPTPAVQTAPPPAATFTLSGMLTATNGGQSLSAATVDVGGSTATADAGGRYSVTLPVSSAPMPLTIHGDGLLSHLLIVRPGTTRTLDADAIQQTGGFDLTFYRAMVRNGYEAPDTLQPLRRWTRTPSIYLKTIDEKGRTMDGPTLNVIEAVLRDAVPRWTSGALGTPPVERGTDSREGVSGWITVKFPGDSPTVSCGRAQVGADGWWIELLYDMPGAQGNCRATGTAVAPTLVRHEIGHALGFYHTGGAADLMTGSVFPSGDMYPTQRELSHAAIAYRRPVGNDDPDTDPSSAVTLRPLIVR